MDDRLERADAAYHRAVFGGDARGLPDADRDLDALEADTALARGRLLHSRYLCDRAADAEPAEDPDELPLFERAAELYRALGDTRGEADALFWMGCLHQVIRHDDTTAVLLLERSRELAAGAGDRSTEAYALRHLGIAAHEAGRLDDARAMLEESTRLRRGTGELPGVAANLVGLAYLAAAQGRPADALAILDEAHAIAVGHDARTVVRHIDEARAHLDPPATTDD